MEQVEIGRVLARALSAADNDGDDAHWQMWFPFGDAVAKAFPTEYSIISSQEVRRLTAAMEQLDLARVAIVENIIRSARILLRDFLDPGDRAVALGRLAECIRELDKHDFNAERNGR